MLAGLGLAALGLRLYGIGFGLPALYRPDEDVVVGRAMGVLSGVFNPHFADWPHLYFYVAAAWVWPLKAAGLIPDQATAYVAIRCLDAVIGALTVLAVYRLGRRAYSRLAGVIAAAAVSVAFLHVRDSHFATLDVPLTLAVLLALDAAHRAASRGGSTRALGPLLGIAASIKYNGALVLAGIAAGQLMKDRLTGLRLLVTGRTIAAIAIVGLIVCIVGSPFLLLDPGTTIHGIGYVFYHLQRQSAPEIGWLRMPIALWYGLDPPLFLLAVAGLVVAALRRTVGDWVLLSFVAVYYALIGTGHSVFFRYVDPLIPCLLLLGARALAEGLLLVKSRQPVQWAAAGVALVVFGFPAISHDVTFDLLIPKQDTRALAAAWMDAHMPAQALAAVPYLPGGLHDQTMIDRGTHSHAALTPYIASFLNGRLVTRYRVHELTADELTATSPAALTALGVRYVVIAYEMPVLGCTASSPLERALAAAGPPVASFRPTTGCPTGVFDVIDGYYVPVSGYDGWVRPGPFIRIYQLPTA